MLTKKLVLFEWAIRQFGARSFAELQSALNRTELEGFSPERTTWYVSEIEHILFDGPATEPTLVASRDVLREMDANIVRHWQHIAAKRTRAGQTIYPTYFQYLSLLFTELYLRSYVTDRSGLLLSLGGELSRFNSHRNDDEHVAPFGVDELNQLAFWSATGSGKTLVMHANLLQFRYYASRFPKLAPSIDQVILITPNERLSEQHIAEFTQSGIPAQIFSQARGQYGMFRGLEEPVQVIEISKLADQTKEKQVAVESFETNNLVFVDEGHKGTGAAGEDPDQGTWVKRRSALSADGFAFEYSATFGQALANGSRLEDQYGKSILFEYSYPRFYHDGYGKEYRILNLRDDRFEEQKQTYLFANIVYYYQQLHVYITNTKPLEPFRIHRPLLAFVGSSVVKGSQDDLSDVATVIAALRDFIANDHDATIAVLSQILGDSLALYDATGTSVFSGAFAHLREAFGVTPRVGNQPVAPEKAARELFAAIKHDLFHGTAGKLQVERLTGSQETKGELLLRLGAAEKPFGVITVGDDAKLKAHLEDKDVATVSDRAISDSFFSVVNDDDSPIHVLVGAKKFIEGWSSWRVSAIGLMKIGQSQGPQVIQLFGRGVRLQGYEFRLKRSKALEPSRKPDLVPNYIEYVETLSVFGVRAGYIETFRQIIEDEPDAVEFTEVKIPRVKPHATHYRKLNYIDLDPAKTSKDQLPVWSLAAPADGEAERLRVQLTWSTALQAFFSTKSPSVAQRTNLVAATLEPQHLPFLDVDEIHADLVEHKNEMRYFNMTIDRDAVSSLLGQSNWYHLQTPPGTTDFDHAGRIAEWQEIAKALLRAYASRFYEYRRAEYENQYLRYRPVKDSDGGLLAESVTAYLPRKRGSDEVDDPKLASAVERIRAMVEDGVPSVPSLEDQQITAVFLDQHLYYPLLSSERTDQSKFSPAGLNKGELDFILALQKYLRTNPEPVAGHEVFVFRNESRGRGLGFFVADNFYPDFMIWLVGSDSQHIVFVDPKGIRNLGGFEHPKLRFHQTIKDVEAQLAKDRGASDPDVRLHSFILSTTPHDNVMWNTNATDKKSKKEFEDRNVLFMSDGTDYVARMIDLTMRSR